MNPDEICGKLSLSEKIALGSGADFWHTKDLETHGIPALTMADGPHGLRKQTDASDMLGINDSVPATCFPTAVSTACSWDEALLSEVGQAIATEAKANGVGVVLGPGANIKRNPLCGRSFEYFSEDPHLTGKLAAAYIRGVEGAGVGSSLKHFACNSQEYQRFSSDSVVDERTLREMYLTGFELAVREGKPATVMCAYNKLNGEHCSDSKELLTDILRTEWGFDGMVVTDWGAMNDRIRAFQAGCDLCMPGGASFQEAEAVQAVKEGRLSENDVDNSVRRILCVMAQGAAATAQPTTADMEAHHELARRAAAESAVLLKNEDGLLPFAGGDDIVLIGHMARQLRYQGSGSSHINPWKLTDCVDTCPDIPFFEGCDADGDTTDELISQAVDAARSAKAAVVFAGLPDQYESEGFDREDMSMPAGHIRLIEAVAAANPNTVVVLLCGSAVELPWADKVKSILYMGLPGQAGGSAIMDLLLGRAVPCGKLAESWPIRYEDCVTSTYYANGQRDAHYREGVYVGYRYYTSAGVPVRYPFGHGLSYTPFSYSDLEIEGDTVRCTVTNVGSVAGKEIVQLYLAPPVGAFYRPVRELKGFCKVTLEPGESKTVEFTLTDRSFAIWNKGWVIPGGQYTVLVGGSSEELPLAGLISKPETTMEAPTVPQWYVSPAGGPSHEDFERLMGHPVAGAPLRKGQFTMENTLSQLKDHSLVMKMVYNAVRRNIAKGFPGKDLDTDPTFRMMLTSTTDASLNGMKIFMGKPSYLLDGLLETANGHYLSAIKTIRKKTV